MTNMENGLLECQFFFPSRLCSKYKGLPPTIRVLTIKIHITFSTTEKNLFQPVKWRFVWPWMLDSCGDTTFNVAIFLVSKVVQYEFSRYILINNCYVPQDLPCSERVIYVISLSEVTGFFSRAQLGLWELNHNIISIPLASN